MPEDSQLVVEHKFGEKEKTKVTDQFTEVYDPLKPILEAKEDE